MGNRDKKARRDALLVLIDEAYQRGRWEAGCVGEDTFGEIVDEPPLWARMLAKRIRNVVKG
jgi:hypothetical protein